MLVAEKSTQRSGEDRNFLLVQTGSSSHNFLEIVGDQEIMCRSQTSADQNWKEDVSAVRAKLEFVLLRWNITCLHRSRRSFPQEELS